jgi:cell division protein FtsB
LRLRPYSNLTHQYISGLNFKLLQGIKNYGDSAEIYMMRVFKYIFAVWMALAVYCGFSFFLGAKGIGAYQQLLDIREKERKNMKALGEISEALEGSRESLRYDADTIAVHARQLGYSKKDEHFIRIEGLGRAQTAQLKPGAVFFSGVPDFISDRTIKIISLCTGFLAFALFFIVDMIRR